MHSPPTVFFFFLPFSLIIDHALNRPDLAIADPADDAIDDKIPGLDDLLPIPVLPPQLLAAEGLDLVFPAFPPGTRGDDVLLDEALQVAGGLVLVALGADTGVVAGSVFPRFPRQRLHRAVERRQQRRVVGRVGRLEAPRHGRDVAGQRREDVDLACLWQDVRDG